MIDYGLGALYSEGEKLTENCGSPSYAAPEMMEEKKRYDPEKSDVWSMGVTLYAMLTGKLPYEH